MICCLYILKISTNLKEAINYNVLAGGDNCSRAAVIGAAFGASGSHIPKEWLDKVNKPMWAEIADLAIKTVTDNSYFA